MTGQSTRKRRAMTEQAADAAVDQACRSLRLPTVRSRFTEIADTAEREQLTALRTFEDLLAYVKRGKQFDQPIGSFQA